MYLRSPNLICRPFKTSVPVSMVHCCSDDLAEVHAPSLASDGLVITRAGRCATTGDKPGVDDSVCGGIKCIKAQTVMIYSLLLHSRSKAAPSC